MGNACDTVCGAALCLPADTPTGALLYRTENGRPETVVFHSEPLEHGSGTSHARPSSNHAWETLPNRSLSGASNSGAQGHARAAGIAIHHPTWSSPDEWPPNKALSGGMYAYVHFITEEANEGEHWRSTFCLGLLLLIRARAGQSS